MRLFIALSIPDATEDALREICHSVAGARFISPGNFHLTLRFMGELDSEAFCTLRNALYDIDFQPFNLTLRGVGHFPLRGIPRTLWAGAYTDPIQPKGCARDPLTSLQRQIEKRVIGLGHQPDKRQFHPHVTLARLSDCRGISERVAQFLAANSLWRTEPFVVDAFHLYSSHTKNNETHYAIEQSYPFASFQSFPTPISTLSGM